MKTSSRPEREGTEDRTTETAGCTSVPRPPEPVPSDELLRGAKWVEISHNGLIYRLQATRLGKLILTK